MSTAIDLVEGTSKTIYTSRFPIPAVTATIAIFTHIENVLHILLVERGQDPHKGKLALPGGFLDCNDDPDLMATAKRELEEETGLSDIPLLFVCVQSTINRDPRQRVIDNVFTAIVPYTEVKAGDDAASAKWYPVDSITELAFDHLYSMYQALYKSGLNEQKLDDSFEEGWCMKRPVPVYLKRHHGDTVTINTLEGPVSLSDGNFKATGSQGEEWPITAANVYRTYELISK